MTIVLRAEPNEFSSSLLDSLLDDADDNGDGDEIISALLPSLSGLLAIILHTVAFVFLSSHTIGRGTTSSSRMN